MFLGPVKALYSIKFYVEYMLKSGWKAFLFLVYVFAVGSLIMAALTFVTGKAPVNKAIDTLSEYTPEMIFANGKLSVNDDIPLEIAPESLGGFKILFDTGREEPVYPTQMLNDNIAVLATDDAIYYAFQGNVQSSPIPEDLNMVINSQAIEEHRGEMTTFILYIVSAMTVMLQALRLPLMVLLAFIIAAVTNGFVRAKITSGSLLKIACYVQAPAMLLALINFVSPVKVPLMFLVYIVLFTVYSRFILNRVISSGAEVSEGPKDADLSDAENPEEDGEEEKQEEDDDFEDKKEI